MQNKNKKKICLIVSSLGKGGAERSAGLLSKALHHSGHDVTIVPILNSVEFDYEGKIFNLGELKEKDDTFFGKVKRFFKFRSFLAREKFDYIIDSRTRVSVKRQQRIAKFLYRSTPVIYMVRSADLMPYLSTDKAAAKTFYSKAFKVVAVTKTIEDKIKSEYGIDNVITINNAVDFDTNSDQGQDQISTKNYILFYGRLVDKIKNVSMLIQAFAQSRLPAEGVEFLILGDGPDRDMLEELANESEAGDSVKFLGHDPNPFPLVKNAKFTVLGSRYEGFPRSVIESLALGVPVISTNYIGNPKEVLTHGENGLIVESENAESFASAMNSFIFDEELYQRCRSNATSSVKHLSIQRIAAEWDKLLV